MATDTSEKAFQNDIIAHLAQRPAKPKTEELNLSGSRSIKRTQ